MNYEQCYEWNTIKEKLNIAKHGVDFSEAKSVFADEYGLVIYDEGHSTSEEERFLLLGMSEKSRVLLVVHCFRENNTIRIISARKATKREKRQYEERK